MRGKRTAAGFTLVELTLAISFIAILLLAIAVLIMQMASIYNKGLTLREANQAGQFISSEIQRSLNQTYSKAVGEIEFTDKSGGRLCAGNVVYAWNYADSLSDTTATNRVNGNSDVRFVKFPGVSTDYCQEQGDGSWRTLPNNAKELLSSGNANIALHSFSFDRLSVVDDDMQTIYAIKMVVGTPSTGLVSGNSCKVDQNLNKYNDEYCAVNQFSFTARSGNREVLR